VYERAGAGPSDADTGRQQSYVYLTAILYMSDVWVAVELLLYLCRAVSVVRPRI